MHPNIFLLFDFFTFIETPIVNTLLTLAIGGFLFKWISDRRAKRDKIREKALEFLDEIAQELNSVISMTFGKIRGEAFLQEDEPLRDQKDELFTKRFTVRIKGEALLNDPELTNKYDLLVWELNDLINLLYQSAPNEINMAALSQNIQARMQQLKTHWPLDNELIPEQELTELFQDFLQWNNMIYERAIDMLTSNMKRLK